jgi:hypothetical protein
VDPQRPRRLLPFRFPAQPCPAPPVAQLIRRPPRKSEVFDSCSSSLIPLYTRLLTERLEAAASASDGTAHEAIVNVKICSLVVMRRLLRGEPGWSSEQRQLATLRLRMERALRGEFGDLWFELEEACKAAARPVHSPTSPLQPHTPASAAQEARRLRVAARHASRQRYSRAVLALLSGYLKDPNDPEVRAAVLDLHPAPHVPVSPVPEV